VDADADYELGEEEPVTRHVAYDTPQETPRDSNTSDVYRNAVPFNQLLSSSKLQPCERADRGGCGMVQYHRQDKDKDKVLNQQPEVPVPRTSKQTAPNPCHRCYSARVLTRPQHFAYTLSSDAKGNGDGGVNETQEEQPGAKSVSVVKLKEGELKQTVRRSHTIAEMNNVRRSFTSMAHFRRNGTSASPFNSHFPPIRAKSHKNLKSMAKDKTSQTSPPPAKSADVIARVNSVNSSMASEHGLNGKADGVNGFENSILNGRKISIESGSSIYTPQYGSARGREPPVPARKLAPDTKEKLELMGNPIDCGLRRSASQKKIDLKDLEIEMTSNQEGMESSAPSQTIVAATRPAEDHREPTPSEVSIQAPPPAPKPAKKPRTKHSHPQKCPNAKTKIKYFCENEQESPVPSRTVSPDKPKSRMSRSPGVHTARLLIPTQNIQDIVNRLPMGYSVSPVHESAYNKPQKISLTKRNLKIFEDVTSIDDSCCTSQGVEEIVLHDQTTWAKESTISNDTSSNPPLHRILHWVKTHQTPEPVVNGAPSTIPDIPEEEDFVSPIKVKHMITTNIADENGNRTPPDNHVVLTNGNMWQMRNGSEKKPKK
jgi:hypothetical protein